MVPNVGTRERKKNKTKNKCRQSHFTTAKTGYIFYYVKYERNEKKERVRIRQNYSAMFTFPFVLQSLLLPLGHVQLNEMKSFCCFRGEGAKKYVFGIRIVTRNGNGEDTTGNQQDVTSIKTKSTAI